MAEESPRVLPGPATENNERITSRPYDGPFAFFPEEETHPTNVPGSGPRGPYEPAVRNWPLVLVAIGLLVAFVGLAVDVALVLLVGLLVTIVGGIWAAIRNRGSASGRGTGPVVARH